MARLVEQLVAISERHETCRPLIISNILDDWPARRWTLNTLEREFGEATVSYASNGRLRLLRAEISRVLADPTYAVGGVRLPEALSAGIGDSIEGLGCSALAAKLFIGGSNSFTPLHRDFGVGLNVQIIGRKRWTMFSPEQTPHLYLDKGFEAGSYQLCGVSPRAPDYNLYPEFACARPLIVNVNEGEGILVPSGWYHEVESMDSTLSLAFAVSMRQLLRAHCSTDQFFFRAI